MESESMLIWGMVFASIGLGFFIYGKKQKKIVPLIAGLALFVFPYFIADISMLMIVGAILIVLPYFVRI
jgi:predicted membrane protein